MLVGLTYDLRTDYVPQPGDPPDANAEFDAPATVELVANAIRSAGHEVVRIGGVERLLERLRRADASPRPSGQRLDDLEVDLVFNIAEGRGGRNRESQVPILLELRQIPYVGSDALTLGLSLDKVVTKQIFRAEGIPTPRAFLIHDVGQLTDIPLPFPLIVKPRHEGSSMSLSEKSRVSSLAELTAQAEWLIRTYRQPALVEEFIRGTEFTVAIIGNDPPVAQPVVQVQLDGTTDLGDRFYTRAQVTAPGVDYLCPARISPAVARHLQALAVRAYQAVECLDFGRVDIRVGTDGRPYVLEINPLPSFSNEDVFQFIAQHLGVSYDTMIHRILDAAINRLRLEPCPAASR